MNERSFLTAEEVAAELGVSISFAYKIIRQLNAELEKRGFLTLTGRVNRRFFYEKAMYGSTFNERDK